MTQTTPATAIHNENGLSHLRVMAAAGSGKTFQLTNRFLRLLLMGVPTRSILASTFTKLAAGEIRHRVVKRLLDAAENQDNASALGRDIGLPELHGDTVRDLLASLAPELQDLQVRTIDGFFATIVRAFAIELGMPGDLNMLDDAATAQLQQETIERILDESEPDEMVEILRRLTMGATDASVAAKLLQSVRGLSTHYHEAVDGAMQFVDPPAGQLDSEMLTNCIADLAALKPDSDKRFNAAREKLLSHAQTGAWDRFVKEKMITNILMGGDPKFGGKPIPDDLYDALEPLIQHAVAVVITRYHDRTDAMERLIRSWDRHAADLKRERGVINFEDLTYALTDHTALGTLDDIYYRIDAHLHHILLDEFQDTSLGQWDVLKPIIDETIAYQPPDRTFFCVGDVKQSIYGWRQASPWILADLPQLLSHGGDERRIQDRPMSKSWRSAPEIIDFTNRVYTDLPRNEAVSDLTNVAEAWMAGFNEHDTAHRAMPGHVSVTFAGGDPDFEGSARDACLEHTVQLVQRLHHEAPEAEIAILVRANRTAADLLHALRVNGVPASSHGGGALIDSAPITIVLDALRLADHAADTESCFNVVRSPLGSELGMTERSWNRAHVRERARAAQKIRRWIAEDGYGATLGRWVALLAPTCTGEEQRKLSQLLALADSFDARATLRTDDFVRFIEMTSVPQGAFAPVRVMSIHQSKGLEFDIVVLPELQWKLIGPNNGPDLYLQRDTPTGPITRLGPSLNKDQRPLIPGLEDMYRATIEATAIDSLSVLYVAITRAIQGLYVILPPPSYRKDGTRGTGNCPTDAAAWLIECAVAPADSDDPEPGDTLMTLGDEAAMIADIRSKHAGRHTADVEETTTPEARDLSGLVSSSVGRAPAASDHATDATDRRRERLTLPNRDALDRGTAIHALFEAIEWTNPDGSLPIDDAALDERLRRVLPDRGADWRDRMRAEFRTMIDHADIAACFAAPEPLESIQVLREHPFARRTAQGLQRGFIDRLHVHRDDRGEAIGATILDFKTDILAADRDPTVEAETHYGAQLAAYAAVVGAMFGLKESTISRMILYVTSGQVVTLASDA